MHFFFDSAVSRKHNITHHSVVDIVAISNFYSGFCHTHAGAPGIINSLHATGAFMCPYKIEKSMYFILTPNIKQPI